jgi:glycerol-3-phosphate dehydrogenase (NAD(P)+)
MDQVQAVTGAGAPSAVGGGAMRATVLGSGNWGTAFAKVLADAGNDVTLWARRPELAEQIARTGRNDAYLPGIELPSGIAVTSDAAAALAGSELVAIAIPSQLLREKLVGWAPLMPPDATLVSLMKGVELGTTKRMSEVIVEVVGVAPGRVAVVTGPNLALEIAREQPTATVVACTDLARAARIQQAISAPYVRPYTNADVVGCELGGAVKNVIALAVGIAHGMGYGDNTAASLITRGLAETARLGAALGADPLTFAGLAGLGDLVATCSSPLSRNRSFGERLGRGETLEQAQHATRGQVAEGAKSCRSVLQLARQHGVDVPITQAVESVCFRGLRPQDMLARFMARSVKSEL